MHMDQLLYLREISNAPSINVASQRLHMNPSTLSVAIRKLEEELGFAIINRSNKGVYLTEYGERLLKCTNLFWDEIKAIQKDSGAQASRDQQGQLRILAGNGVQELFSKYNYTFKAQYPAVSIRVAQESADALLERFTGEAYDLAFMYQPSGLAMQAYLAGTGLAYREILEMGVSVRVHKNMPLAKYQAVSLKTVLQYPIIIYKPEGVAEEQHSIVKMLSKLGQPRKIIFEENRYMIQEMLEHQVGVTLGFPIPSFAVPHEVFDTLSTVSIPISDLSTILYCFYHEPLSFWSLAFLEGLQAPLSVG